MSEKYLSLIRVIIIALPIIAVSSCALSETDLNDNGGDILVFYASNGDSLKSKTVLQTDGAIYWNPQESINLFYGEGYSSRFVSTNTVDASEVEFHGTLDGFEYNDSDLFYAVYPYKEGNSNNNGLIVSLPEEQNAVAGTFDRELFISVAKSQDFYLHFYNVCGGIKFSVSEAGVKSVTFKGNNGEAIAGTAKVAFDQNGKPVVQEVTNPLSEVTLSAPTGTTLEVGKWYYIVCFPTVLQNGFTMTLNKEDGTMAKKKGDSSVTIKRAIWGQLTEMDKNLAYCIPDNEIWYTTTNGETIAPNLGSEHIVNNYYADGKGIITLDGTIDQIPSSAFNACNNLQSISIPESICSIGSSAFADCANLATISLPCSLQTISNHVFSGCSQLRNITIPDSVTSIGDYAFFCCSSLESVVIPPKVKEIPQIAFGRCDNLTSVTLPDGLLSIGAGAFVMCPKLQNVPIPETVTYIGDGAFSGCESFTRMVIPSGITLIGYSMFSACTNLQEVVLPEGITKINYNAFYKCPNLSRIIIPSTVEIISSSVFAFCTSLSKIVFPSKVTTLGDKIVEGCTNLSSIVVNNPTPPSILSATFDDSNDCPIYVPIGSLAAYRAAWDKYSFRLFATPPEAIDLGLSVKWASCNLGADNPRAYGIYYSWGVTDPESYFSWTKYKWCNGSSCTLTKYNVNSSYGNVDNNTVLFASDDVAHVNLGGKWRIPTSEEWEELISNCTTEYYYNGSYGWLVTSKKNGAKIFLPFPGIKDGEYFNAAGYSGSYWSSSLCLDDPSEASYVHIDYGSIKLGSLSRNCGVSVRPVYGDYIRVAGIQLKQSKLELVVGETEALMPIVSPANAMYKTLSWSSSDPNVATVNGIGEVTAIAEGTVIITATTYDGGYSATCQVSVSPAPLLDFNPESYLVYKANPSGGWDARKENYYHYESSLTGFSAKVVEMKFQLAYSSDASCTIACDNLLKDWYQDLRFTSSQLIWDQGDPTNYRCTISLSDAGVNRTSLITLRFDGNAKTLSINGKSFSVPYELFGFGHLMAEYNRKSDEGTWESTDGIPDGSKIYYIKGWDKDGNLTYLGYPTKAINPRGSNEEYCWYTYWNKKTTYQFANDSVNQGGYGGYIP